MVESLLSQLDTVKLGVAPDMFVVHDHLEVLIVKGGIGTSVQRLGRGGGNGLA